mgnify:CR=1 FL=1
MKKTLFLFIIFLASLEITAQGEASNWYFGYGAGIQFDQATGNIDVVDNGQLSTNEGCSSISDTNGNLLFYSDGTTVWNQNHAVMQNGTGLFGDSSSTQSAIIVPKPDDINIYYIFTVDNAVDGNNFGFNYSEIDMTLDGGLGAVTNKNINLLPICSEKISAVLKDCITKSIWVITFASQNGTLNSYNTFHAFEVNNTGVNTTAVVSPFNLNITDARGYLKLSPDGTKLANANMRDGLFLYNFDVTTGIVSNQQTLTISGQSNRPYGVEFSQNNQFLYIHSSNDYFNQQDPIENNNPANHSSSLTQFDLNAADIQTSEFAIDQRQLYRGGLQLAPDGKIYRALSSTYSEGLPFLGVINNPNDLGNASNYQHNSVSLSPNNSSQGLPPFIQSLFNLEIDIIQNGVSTINLDLCDGDTYTLISEDIQGATYTWTLDDNLLSETDFDLDIDQAGHYQVFIDPNNGDCATEGQAYVSYYEIPVANQPSNIDVCDDNNDSVFSLDLSLFADAQILGIQDASTFNISYFESLDDANNDVNEVTTPYLNSNNPQEIFARIENTNHNECYDTTSFFITVYNTPIANSIEDREVCDNNLDGNDSNGQITTNLLDINTLVLGNQNAADYTITYHSSQSDADTRLNNLTASYYNLTPNQEEVFVRIENILHIDCFDTTSFNIIVNPVPEAFDVSLFQCDEDGIPEGFTIFNLTEVNDDLTGGTTNRSTQFYTSLENAQNSTNPIDETAFNNYENPQTIYVQVINDTTGCFSIAELLLEVSSTSANDAELSTCDDDGTEDGYHTFNLSDADATVLNTLPSDVTLQYYETYENALLENNPLSTGFTNTIPYNQTIYVRVEDNNACYGINEVNLVVFELPNIEITDELLYCLNYYPELITLTGGVINDVPNNYYFNWSTGATTTEIQVNEVGNYTVSVTNTNGCSKERTISIIPSNIATIESFNVVDASSNNSIRVNVSGEGDYEFSINNIYGPYQGSNLFENVKPGIHTIFVRDRNDCGIVEGQVSVIGFPKFFTPNNDSYNDLWHVYGINTANQYDSTVYIFDRFGKLITQLDPKGPGWDGTFNGHPLPTSDYWFYVTLQDGRAFKSHFTLKR